MGIITRMRKQDAVYWKQTAPDKYTKTGVGPAIPIKVRWDDVNEKFMSLEGDEQMSNAIVYVPEVTTGVEMKAGDYLWLGSISDIPNDVWDNPPIHEDVHEIRKFGKIADLKAKEFLRTAIL